MFQLFQQAAFVFLLTRKSCARVVCAAAVGSGEQRFNNAKTNCRCIEPRSGLLQQGVVPMDMADRVP